MYSYVFNYLLFNFYSSLSTSGCSVSQTKAFTYWHFSSMSISTPSRYAPSADAGL